MDCSITYKDFISVYLRSYLYQNLINDKYFQNFGFLYTLYPVIKKFHAKKESIKVFFMKNFEYYNTNPFLASFIHGVAMKMIEENNDRRLKKFKFDMMSPLAAIGDAISWGILRSFLIMVSVIFVFFNYYSGILIFLIFFNLILNVFFRFFGMIIGYKSGMNVIYKIANLDLQSKIAMIKKTGLVIWGCAVFLLLRYKYKLIDLPAENIIRISPNNIASILLMILISVLLYKGNKYVVPIVIYIIYIMIITVVISF